MTQMTYDTGQGTEELGGDVWTGQAGSMLETSVLLGHLVMADCWGGNGRSGLQLEIATARKHFIES